MKKLLLLFTVLLTFTVNSQTANLYALSNSPGYTYGQIEVAMDIYGPFPIIVFDDTIGVTVLPLRSVFTSDNTNTRLVGIDGNGKLEPYTISSLPFVSTETDPLFNTKFSSKSTTDLAEGSNLYWTASRFNTSFTGKTTSDLTEGTNLYFTNARARGAISLTTSGTSGTATYSSITGILNIPNYTYTPPTRSDTIITRPINSTAFRPSDLTKFSGQDVQGNYSISVTVVSVLGGTATGTVYLEKSANGTSGWITVSQSGLAVSGLVTGTTNTQTVSGFISKTWYARIRTVSSTTGIGSSVSFTYQTGQENNY